MTAAAIGDVMSGIAAITHIVAGIVVLPRVIMVMAAQAVAVTTIVVVIGKLSDQGDVVSAAAFDA